MPLLSRRDPAYRHDVHAAFELQTIYRLQKHFQKYLKKRVSYYYQMQYENCQFCGCYFISSNYGTYCLYQTKTMKLNTYINKHKYTPYHK